jgi:ribonuclease Y
MLLWILIGSAAGAVIGVIAFFFLETVVNSRKEADLRETQQSATRALADAETQAKEIVLAAKEEAHRVRSSAEDEARQRQQEILALEHKTQQREDLFIRRLDELEQRQKSLQAEAEQQRGREATMLERETRLRGDLEQLAGMTREQARAQLLQTLEQGLAQEYASRVKLAEEAARHESERRARQIVVTAIQRVAADQTTESTISAVHLPNDEMKGPSSAGRGATFAPSSWPPVWT